MAIVSSKFLFFIFLMRELERLFGDILMILDVSVGQAAKCHGRKVPQPK